MKFSKPYSVLLILSKLSLLCNGYSFATHESMIIDSLEVVNSIITEENETGMQTIIEEIKTRQELFVNGTIDADLHGGSIFDGFVERSTFSHFYDPQTKSGFSLLHPLDFGNLPRFLRNLGILSPLISQAVGSAIPMTSMAQWYYSRALNQYFDGEVNDAVHSLGFVIHYVQDITVPQHSNNCGAESPSCMHGEFEGAINERFLSREIDLIPNVTYEELNSLSQMDVGMLVEFGAEQSHDLLQDASQNQDEWFNVADQMIPLGLELGAAVIFKFIQDIVNQNVDYDTIVLMIDRVELQQLLQKADLQPVVHVLESSSGQQIDFYDASVITNARVAEPQLGMDATGWIFVHTLTDSDIADGFVTFQLEIYDRRGDTDCLREGFCTDDNGKRMKVTPDGETLLNITFSLDDEEGAISETSMGCEESTTTTTSSIFCSNSVSVTYTVGRSSDVDITSVEYGLPFVLRSVTVLELIFMIVLVVAFFM